jgi:hypothetical protein
VSHFDFGSRSSVSWMIFAFKLHGCQECGKKPLGAQDGEVPMHQLHCDHRDPATKKFSVSSDTAKTKPKSEVLAELAKTDVLCQECHLERGRERRRAGLAHDRRLFFKAKGWEFEAYLDSEQLALLP